MRQQVKFLSIGSKIFKVLAWISAAFFIIVTGIVLFGFGGADTPRIASLVFLFGGALYFLILFCIAEVFKILVTICDKTSKVLEILEGKVAGK